VLVIPKSVRKTPLLFVERAGNSRQGTGFAARHGGSDVSTRTVVETYICSRVLLERPCVVEIDLASDSSFPHKLIYRKKLSYLLGNS
jgi:hypothetical protein